jgi:hypothetical protein
MTLVVQTGPGWVGIRPGEAASNTEAIDTAIHIYEVVLGDTIASIELAQYRATLGVELTRGDCLALISALETVVHRNPT